ncbi:MAG TPA: hypothetical protein VMT45_13265 [Thermoanaerobaculaceae bacterium]|nr:hypothetical protein [Thermoanaerobaculaceae bacterium]
MGPISDSSKTVLAIHLGCRNGALAMLEERRNSSPRFTLVHYSRLPSKASFGAFATGAAEIVRKQARRGLDWQLVLGSLGDQAGARELIAEELWPLLRTVRSDRTIRPSAVSDGHVSGWALASTLRSRFESRQLRLAASPLGTKEHIDRLLESLLGPQTGQSSRESSPGTEELDDLVVAAGLALWWAERQGDLEGEPRPERLVPRLLPKADLL